MLLCYLPLFFLYLTFVDCTTKGKSVQEQTKKTEAIELPPFTPAQGQDSEEEVEFHREEEEDLEEEEEREIYLEPCTTAF